MQIGGDDWRVDADGRRVDADDWRIDADGRRVSALYGRPVNVLNNILSVMDGQIFILSAGIFRLE